MMYCIIIEDQPPAQRILKNYIEQVDFLELKHIFSDAISANEYMKTNPIDLIFLDIHLPKISGIDFLKSQENHPSVILTTAFSDYALESYELNVIDYLLKPFSFDRFLKAIHKVAPKVSNPNTSENIFIKTGHEHIKINMHDIFYIKADSDYTEIITPTKKHLSKESLKFWVEKLEGNNFCQIHKSYVINIQHLKKVASNQVYLDQEVLPIGRAYKKKFTETYLS